MQLIVILLTIVSILTLLSGIIVFFGSSKGHRVRSAWFLLAAIFATAWMASISIFLTAQPEQIDTMWWHVEWTFISAILIDVFFLGYIAWREKYGPITTIIFAIFGLIVSSLILLNPDSFYTDIVLSRNGNSIVLNKGPVFYSYIAFFLAIVPAIITVLLKQFVKTKSDRKRGGDLVIMISFGISSTLTLVANLILPLLGNWNLIWLGPLTLSATIIALYYTALRYRSLNLSSIWLKLFSSIIITASIAIIYMIIFAIVFAALFHGSTPSNEVIILNFIMILIFITLIPALNELIKYVHSLLNQKPKIHHRKET